jgi:rhodanese-related sulfurtransferase
MKRETYLLIFLFAIFVFGASFVSAQSSYMDVTPQEALKLMLETTDLVTIDVSPLYQNGHLPTAINHPVGDGSLDKAIPMLDKNMSYLVYCHADGPSISGSQKLVDAGVMKVYRLIGNYKAWTDAGYPVSMPMPYVDVTPQEALKLMLETTDLVTIDVSPAYAMGHLPKAVNYPVGDGSLDKAIPMLHVAKTYLVYCHADGPSISGSQKLVDAGVMKVYRLIGNYKAWTDVGYPVEK